MRIETAPNATQGTRMNSNGAQESIPTLLIEESRLFREGLKRLLAGTAYQIQVEADSIGCAVAKIGQGFAPMLVLLDFRDNDRDAVDGVGLLRGKLPSARIVVLTFDVSTAKLANAFEAGADAYLLYDMSPEALVQSLNLVMLGEKVLPTNLAQILIEGRIGIANGNGHALDAGTLSEREVQILRCLVNGDPNKVIAHRLRMTEATVKVSLKGLLRKIRASNRTQAAIWAVEQGIDRYPLAGVAAKRQVPLLSETSTA